LTYSILVTKKKPANLSVSGNKKTSTSHPQATGLANTGTTGRKRKSEPQVTEQAPPPPKKKMKASVDPSQPSATATATKRNRDNHAAPSKMKSMDNSGKRRPYDDATVNTAHPAKKAKVAPIRRTGKIVSDFLMLNAC
jgi:hypothetical protein